MALRRGWDKSVLIKVKCERYRYGNRLRWFSLTYVFYEDILFCPGLLMLSSFEIDATKVQVD